MRRCIIVHPFLFALASIVSFALTFSIEAAPGNIASLMIGSVLMTVALWGILFLVLKQHLAVSALITSLALTLFFSYGTVRYALLDLMGGPFGLARHRYHLIVWAVLFLAGSFLFVRFRRWSGHLTRAAHMVGAAFLLLPVLFWWVGQRSASTTILNVESETVVERHSVERRPNIFYIILDGYGGVPALRDAYGFDNSPFLTALAERGFYVAPDARSNYTTTFLSLPSTLAMDYLPGFASSLGADSLDRRLLYEMVENNRVFETVQARGYTVVNFGSGVGATQYLRSADENVNCEWMGEFVSAFFSTTALVVIQPRLTTTSKGTLTLCTFDRLEEMAQRRDDPFFAYAHIVEPHPPYVFGPNGEIRRQAEWSYDKGWEEKEKYLDQVRFINTRVLQMIDVILTQSEAPPIIILQADHGPASSGGVWEPSNVALVQERTSILYALYAPEQTDGAQGGGTQTLMIRTPINTFRWLFNTYFNTGLPLLPDRIFFSSYERPYDWNEITEQVFEPADAVCDGDCTVPQ